jgi:hypothetical protein
MQSINVLPPIFQREWMAGLVKCPGDGYKLISISETAPGGFQERRLIVTVIDENGKGIAGQPVAFAYSTASTFTIPETSVWSPPYPRRADVPHTLASGSIEHIQGGPIREGQPGGVTVYVLSPNYPSL